MYIMVTYEPKAPKPSVKLVFFLRMAVAEEILCEVLDP
jgi:hypothetical protein